ncbi:MULTISPECIES: hypothetical protein [unclassified Curtobacterium]|uniref:hypothetical protein n=1 Tax=unclassified Curtobacterium TaxID=257496 RepID=UPI001114E7AA|nr:MULTISPECIES: hypothetical protein [unclassified Curtobacterium]WIA98340.1 hypothetical protein QOL16_08130 [Curtobacterium sp. MCBA15_004]
MAGRIPVSQHHPNAYRLWLPAPEIRITGDSIDVVVNGSSDHLCGAGEGGLIDAITRSEGVSCSLSPDDFHAGMRWHEERRRELWASLSEDEEDHQYYGSCDARVAVDPHGHIITAHPTTPNAVPHDLS